MSAKKFSEYCQRLRHNFFQRLERKTGWGKEELKKEFYEATQETLMELIDATPSKTIHYFGSGGRSTGS